MFGKSWSGYSPNVESDVHIHYCKRAVAIPSLDDTNFRVNKRLKNQVLVNAFSILPSPVFSNRDTASRKKPNF